MGKVKVDRRFFPIVVTEQHLDSAQVRTGFEQMSGEAVTELEPVRVYTFVETRTPGSLPASEPDHLGIDRMRGRMPTITGEEPGLGLQSAPVLAQGFEQDGTEHDVPILAALATLEVDDHPLTIDVADLQASQFGALRWRRGSSAKCGRREWARR